jgi:putative transposase
MPNHFHLVLHQKADNGISRFLKKVGTGYSMYFNKKYGHSGILFQGRFKSRHINNEAYQNWIFAYVHLNPLELFCGDWERSGIADVNGSRSFLHSYPYCSFVDYYGAERREGNVLNRLAAPSFLSERNDLEELLRTVLNNSGDNS